MSEIRKIFYRSIEISMLRHVNGDRDWMVLPKTSSAQQGSFSRIGGSGSYAGAVAAAEAAIDRILAAPPDEVEQNSALPTDLVG